MPSEAFPGSLLLSYGTAPYDIHLEAKSAGNGNDIIAVITGGTRPHVGAVALAEPAFAAHPVTGEPDIAPHPVTGERDITPPPSADEPGAKRPVPVSVPVASLSASGHKDAVLAEMFAKGLCERFGVNVCASAGVHVDGANQDEIALMVENAKKLLAIATA